LGTVTSKAPEAITFDRDYPGTISQARQARADLTEAAGQCPVAIVALAAGKGSTKLAAAARQPVKL